MTTLEDLSEFKTKHGVYQKNRTTRWIEIDSPTSFAINCNSDILNYAIPPFAGILREVYEIEDYSDGSAKNRVKNF